MLQNVLFNFSKWCPTEHVVHIKLLTYIYRGQSIISACPLTCTKGIKMKLTSLKLKKKKKCPKIEKMHQACVLTSDKLNFHSILEKEINNLNF